MGEFNLAELLADVSELDTGLNEEQLQYIDVDKLHADERNFYQLSDLDKLMSSIELLGLQQPVRVRPEGENYVIVSGHRRTEAIRRLVDEGKENFRRVPCIVERTANSPELQELRLIFANSDTRVLSSSELQKQAERVEELLYKLKEQGMEFPGRMRDHVAEACKLSKSKLARLKAIKNHLAFELKFEYEQGHLNEACAYALCQLDREDQLFIYRHLYKHKYVYESCIKSMAKYISTARDRDCPEDLCGGKCEHVEGLTQKVYSCGYQGYSHCANSGCCSNCSDIGACSHVCPHMKDAAKVKKAEAKEAAAKAKAEEDAKNLPKIENIKKLWSRFGEACRAAGVEAKEFNHLVGSYYAETEFRKYEDGSAKFNVNTYLPYQGIRESDIGVLCKSAGLFGCSLDYLLCRTDEPGGLVPDPDTTVEWKTGTPTRLGPYLCKVECEGATIKSTLRMTATGWRMHGGQTIDEGCKVIGWWPVPED